MVLIDKVAKKAIYAGVFLICFLLLEEGSLWVIHSPELAIVIQNSGNWFFLFFFSIIPAAIAAAAAAMLGTELISVYLALRAYMAGLVEELRQDLRVFRK
jgi:hypothetical protein